MSLSCWDEAVTGRNKVRSQVWDRAMVCSKPWRHTVVTALEAPCSSSPCSPLPFIGAVPANGVVGEQVFEGTTGLFQPYGNRFGRYSRQGQVAGSSGPSDELYVMGRWIRIAGKTGVYANMVGCCATDYADVFDPWFVGSLP